MRVIGGLLRGRRIGLAPEPGLRPTPDRVRETLFNWLTPMVRGALCLDLFAGSGALGIEALSRGARQVVFVDRSPACAAALRGEIERLALSAEVWQMSAESYLAAPGGPFDIVFLDPPFDTPDYAALLDLVASANCLAPAAAIYLELAARNALPVLPPLWRVHRSGRAGDVGYHLLLRES